MRCRDCGAEYLPEDETRLDGQPLGLCPDCAEDFIFPSVNFEGWDD